MVQKSWQTVAYELSYNQFLSIGRRRILGTKEARLSEQNSDLFRRPNTGPKKVQQASMDRPRQELSDDTKPSPQSPPPPSPEPHKGPEISRFADKIRLHL